MENVRELDNIQFNDSVTFVFAPSEIIIISQDR